MCPMEKLGKEQIFIQMPNNLKHSKISLVMKGKNIDISIYTPHIPLSLQSCPTLCDSMDCSPPDSSVHGILQARILKWVAMPSYRGLNLHLLCLLHCRQILYHLATGQAHSSHCKIQKDNSLLVRSTLAIFQEGILTKYIKI